MSRLLLKKYYAETKKNTASLADIVTVNVVKFGAYRDRTHPAETVNAVNDAVVYLNTLGGGKLYFPDGNYTVNETLYIYGNIDIDFSPNAKIYIENCDVSVKYIFAMGAKKNDVYANVKWTGRFSNAKIDCGNIVQFGGIINVFRAEDYVIENNYFTNFRSVPIKGHNNANYANGNLLRRNGKYIKNSLINPLSSTPTLSDNTEGISVSALDTNADSSYNFLITDNFIYGTYDDPIAIHGCCDVIISNNICKSYDGRILASNAKNVTISGNEIAHLVYTTDTIIEGGWHIHLEDEDGVGRQCENISIINNKITIDGIRSNISYCIRAIGAKNVDIVGNKIINNATYNSVVKMINAIEIIDATRFNAYNTHIKNNTIVNGKIRVYGATDSVVSCVDNNIINGSIYVRKAGVYKNNFYSIDTDRFYDGNPFYVANEKKFDIVATLANGQNLVALNFTNGMSSEYIGKKTQVLGYRATITSAIPDNWVSITLYKNGVDMGNGGVSMTNPSGLQKVSYFDITKSLLNAGDVLTAKIDTTSIVGTITGFKMKVEIYYVDLVV